MKSSTNTMHCKHPWGEVEPIHRIKVSRTCDIGRRQLWNGCQRRNINYLADVEGNKRN